jgi:hypothetical protein
MGEITTFLTEAYNGGFFVGVSNRAPELLLEQLNTEAGDRDRIKTFMAHASRSAFCHLTVTEVLAGKVKESKRDAWTPDLLQERMLAAPFPDRLARVLREAKYWDQQLTPAAAFS